MDAYLGEIRIFSGTFAPANWAFCSGQSLSIQQYAALYSLLGTAYGGNGTTSFNLPNLQGLLALGAGTGPGMTPRTNGNTGGSLTATVGPDQLGTHSHAIRCQSGNGNSGTAAGNYPASSTTNRSTNTSFDTPYADSSDGSQMATGMLSSFGGGPGGNAVAHNNIQPYVGINYIICLSGNFPPRS